MGILATLTILSNVHLISSCSNITDLSRMAPEKPTHCSLIHRCVMTPRMCTNWNMLINHYYSEPLLTIINHYD